MTIGKNSVVTLHVAILDAERNVLPETVGELSYLHGYGDLFPRVQAALEGKSVGDKVDVALAPAEAYGELVEGLVFKEALSALPEGVEVGTLLECERKDDGMLEYFRIAAIEGGDAILDGNHPLAGVDIVVCAEVLAIRAATADEISMGTMFPLD